jgi:CrcB protein
MITKLALLGAAGAAGAVSRYLLSGAVQRLAGSGFPLGTFAANMAGCFFFGLLWGLFEHRLPLGGQARIIILTGFMGSFTTFSTFAFETASLLQHGQGWLALLNAGGQLAAGLALVVLGMGLGRVA